MLVGEQEHPKKGYTEAMTQKRQLAQLSSSQGCTSAFYDKWSFVEVCFNLGRKVLHSYLHQDWVQHQFQVHLKYYHLKRQQHHRCE